MRCRECGMPIANGTLCEDCYNKKSKNIKNEENGKVLLKLTRKFLPKYQLLQMWEWILFGIFVVIMSFFINNIATGIIGLLFVLIILAWSLFINKRIANATKCTFYENKVVYKFDFLFIHNSQVYSYKDIKDITYNQRMVQKKFKLGTLYVHNKKSGILFHGFIIDDVQNIEEVFEKLKVLVKDKIF